MKGEYKFNLQQFSQDLKEVADSLEGDRYKKMSIDSGVSETAIWSFVKNPKEPTMKNLLKICNWLGKNPKDYFEKIKPENLQP